MKRFALKDLPQQPWKNGGGTTRTAHTQRAKDAAAPFDWRVSIAEIVENGPFSLFPGVDRIAVVLENGPLRLSTSPALGHLVQPLYVAQAHCPIAFDGETELFSDIGDGPVLCLNIMTRRSAAAAMVRVLHSDELVKPGDGMILFAAGAGWKIGNVHLEKYEGLLLDQDAPVAVRAPGVNNGPLISISIQTQ
jgi:environmental stress-induced protein Ves